MREPFLVREATGDDAERIAAVHMESVRSLGAGFYRPEIVCDWGRPRGGERYANAMAGGERFFVAVGGDSDASVLGFSSYRVVEAKHRIAVYVAGRAARQGAGTALFRAAEDVAGENGALAIHVDASLAAVDFYRANGLEELARGQHSLRSGAMMDCVFMRKVL